MDYARIGGFLEKFKKILFQKEEILFVIVKTISKHTSIILDVKKIKIKNAIIYIEAKPIQKSEIFMNKNKILEDLKQEVQNLNFVDIK
jgi:hypothetical protein